VNTLKRICLLCCLVTAAAVVPHASGQNPAPKTDAAFADAEKTLAKLSQLVGGTWVNNDPKMRIEFRHQWAFGNKIIKGQGAIDKGGPREQQVENFVGVDPAKRSVFYLDCHGGTNVFSGNVTLDGQKLVFEFATLVGPAAKWREVAAFPDKDTLQFTISGERNGKWVSVVNATLKRQTPNHGPGELVTEGIIEAPVDAVWAALTTKEGQESWNVAHAEIDLKIGGTMRTHYDPKGTIGDPGTIENRILCFEPKRMLAIRVTGSPANFPFKSAIQKMWTVIRLENAGPSRTRLSIVGVGYGDDEESQKLRAFFDRGNSYTLKKLQEKFAAKARTPANAG